MILTPSWALAVAGLLLLYRFLPPRLRDGFLAAGSFAWLAVLDPGGMLLLAGLALLVWVAAPRGPAGGRRVPTAVPVIALLAVLGWFKYVPRIVAAASGGGPAELVLPIGISYFTFKLVHYAVERGRGNITDRSLPRFLSWVFLLPAFPAGPIERFDHYLENRRETVTREDVAEGLTRILYGLVKKTILCAALGYPLRRLGGPAGFVAGLHGFSTGAVWGICILQYLRLYLDFSAYTDLAVGTSRLFGIRLMENFRWPVLARDIGDFWNRWHMTLSGWCRTYVYMPLIGLTRRPHLAAYATFLTIALWHAGTLHFVLWGLYHGTGVALYRLRRRRRGPLRRPLGGWRDAPAVVATFLFVSGSFALTLPFPDGGARDGLRVLLKLVGVNA